MTNSMSTASYLGGLALQQGVTSHALYDPLGRDAAARGSANQVRPNSGLGRLPEFPSTLERTPSYDTSGRSYEYRQNNLSSKPATLGTTLTGHLSSTTAASLTAQYLGQPASGHPSTSYAYTGTVAAGYATQPASTSSVPGRSSSVPRSTSYRSPSPQPAASYTSTAIAAAHRTPSSGATARTAAGTSTLLGGGGAGSILDYRTSTHTAASHSSVATRGTSPAKVTAQRATRVSGFTPSYSTSTQGVLASSLPRGSAAGALAAGSRVLPSTGESFRLPLSSSGRSASGTPATLTIPANSPARPGFSSASQLLIPAAAADIPSSLSRRNSLQQQLSTPATSTYQIPTSSPQVPAASLHSALASSSNPATTSQRQGPAHSHTTSSQSDPYRVMYSTADVSRYASVYNTTNTAACYQTASQEPPSFSATAPAPSSDAAFLQGLATSAANLSVAIPRSPTQPPLHSQNSQVTPSTANSISAFLRPNSSFAETDTASSSPRATGALRPTNSPRHSRVPSPQLPTASTTHTLSTLQSAASGGLHHRTESAGSAGQLHHQQQQPAQAHHSSSQTVGLERAGSQGLSSADSHHSAHTGAAATAGYQSDLGGRSMRSSPLNQRISSQTSAHQYQPEPATAPARSQSQQQPQQPAVQVIDLQQPQQQQQQQCQEVVAVRPAGSPLKSRLRGCALPSQHGGAGCVGLQNLGNTCFMNSILQVLNAVPELVMWAHTHISFKPKSVVAPAYLDLVQSMWRGNKGVVTPSVFQRSVSRLDSRWGDGSQQDAQEFLHALLEALQCECNLVVGKPQYKELQGKGSEAAQAAEADAYARTWHDSVVDDIFGGLMQSTLQCQVCKRESHTFEPFMDLALPIPATKSKTVSLQDCLHAFVEVEQLDGSDSYKCESCKKCCPHTKRLQIYRPPHALVLTLKRFTQKASGGLFSRFRSAQKNNAAVGLEVDCLNLAPYCNPLGLKACGLSRPTYQLASVSHHSGSLEGGHYTASARSAADGQWYYFNDSSVRRDSAPSGPSTSAYVLVYLLDQ